MVCLYDDSGVYFFNYSGFFWVESVNYELFWVNYNDLWGFLDLFQLFVGFTGLISMNYGLIDSLFALIVDLIWVKSLH